jgi:sugar transferase (PEP-CTERM/EpsH1 system associated)
MPIRIMHVVNNLGKGGLENGLVNLVERLDPRKFEHIVCTVRGLGPNADRLPLDRVRLLPLASADSNSRFQTPALVRAIRSLRPHIVHSRNWAAIEAVVAARVARACAVVHSEHGFEAEAWAAEPRRRIYFRRLAFELADQVLSVSSQLRDVHAGRTGFPARRIAVIHNGVDCEKFFPDPAGRASARDELGIGEAEFCIGCVANLLPVKAHMTLLAALDAMPEQAGEWRLLLIGDGPERPGLEAFVEAHPRCKQRVRFLGSSGRVPELLRGMDVFVLPSLAEGICNSLLEAMATGLPVVATAVGGNPEVVVDGESGLLFPARDVRALSSRLLQLGTDRRLRAQLARGAIQRVREEFSIASMVRAYEQLYAGLRPAWIPALSAG